MWRPSRWCSPRLRRLWDMILGHAWSDGEAEKRMPLSYPKVGVLGDSIDTRTHEVLQEAFLGELVHGRLRVSLLLGRTLQRIDIVFAFGHDLAKRRRRRGRWQLAVR